ncbi:MAG: hypothetical protein D6696_13555, partial [Acidobacteria bacterium]
MGRRRRWLIGVVVVLGTVAAACVVLRDRPRRLVEAALAERLAAEVTLGRLQILGRRRARLVDLTVRQPAAYPWLRRLEAATVDAEGPLGEMLDGRFSRLLIAGLEAELDPRRTRSPATAAAGAAAGELRARVVDVDRARLVLAGAEGAPATLSGRLEDVGGALHGRLTLAAGGRILGPLLAAAGLGGVQAPPGDVSAGVVITTRGDRRQVTARGRLPATAAARGDLILAGGGVERFEVRFEGIDAGAWTAVNAAAGSGLAVAGDADLTIAGEGLEALRFHLRSHLDSPRWRRQQAELAADALDLVAGGTLRRDGETWQGPCTARLQASAPRLAIPALSLPAAAAPRAASFAGTLSAGGERWIEGTLELVTTGAGTLHLDGAATLEPPELDLRWRWPGSDLGLVAELLPRPGDEPRLELAGRADLEGTARGSPAAPDVTVRAGAARGFV